MWRRRSGVLAVFFSFVNGGRGLSQHIQKRHVSFGQKRPRLRGEPSSRPAPVWRQRRASISNQVGRPVRVRCAHPQLVATLPAPVLASGTIGVGWVGRGRGRGAPASGSSCVASQGRHHRMSWSWKGSAVGPGRRYKRRQELLPLLGAPGCGRGSRRRRLTPAVWDRAVARCDNQTTTLGATPPLFLSSHSEKARRRTMAAAPC